MEYRIPNKFLVRNSLNFYSGGACCCAGWTPESMIIGKGKTQKDLQAFMEFVPQMSGVFLHLSVEYRPTWQVAVMGKASMKFHMAFLDYLPDLNI